VSTLGRDGDFRSLATPRRERVGNQQLVVSRLTGVLTIRIGGIDQPHAGIERSVDGSDASGSRGAPTFGEVHRPEADACGWVPEEIDARRHARRVPRSSRSQPLRTSAIEKHAVQAFQEN
jgi:hypothetical protein